MAIINFGKVVEVDIYEKALSENADEFKVMLREAIEEINFYDWCLDILETYVGMFYAGIVGVFLFKIKPSGEEIDELIWVIVGDLPPIYITAEDSPNPACALDSYIGAMEEWVEAAENERSVSNLVPVNVPATKENAKNLKVRLMMLDEKILSKYKEDLQA